MNKIPLQVKLKRETHRRIASAQDLIVQEVYAVFERAVLHGGTAIWRCYNGKRFSEDLDFYLPKDTEKIEDVFRRLQKVGFRIIKKKIGENSIYSELELERTAVRFEATFQKIPGVLCDYELSNGNFMPIYSLTKEQFLEEKVQTYLKRYKVRDLWDIFFLLQGIENPCAILGLQQLITHYTKPVDEPDLKVIILEGIVPTAEEMKGYITRKWENKYI